MLTKSVAVKSDDIIEYIKVFYWKDNLEPICNNFVINVNEY